MASDVRTQTGRWGASAGQSRLREMGHMTRQEICHAEWQNSDNWSGSGPLAVYFSKKDRRTWVRKRASRLGWTPNLAHPAGVLWMFVLTVGVPMTIAAVLLAMLAGQ